MTTRRLGLWLKAFLALISLSVAAGSRADIAVGENVNMVTGRKMPGGDPYLQRQNEPSVAISSLNPNHLLAGANDYRTVDIPFPDAPDKAAGDAWAGVFKSLDGGRTWQSTLLPGFPQDASAEGAASPIRICRNDPPPAGSTTPVPVKCVAAADPVIRAGTDGLFYYTGIAFTRDALASKVYVARFLDGNDRENGDVTESQDPIRYKDAVQIAAGGPVSAPFCAKGAATGELVFLDKPWIAVDVPRGYEQRCALTGKQAGAIYAVWAAFHVSRDCTSGADTDLYSDVMFSQSLDCGATWSAPIKINTKNSVMNQGASIAIEPITGRLYVAWRRAAAAGQTDAIMATRSHGRKKMFSNPRVVAAIFPFDQVQNGTRIRTQTMPSLAISSNGASSWAHIAWSQRSAAPSAAAGPLADARIVVSSAAIHPPPSGDQDPDEDETVEVDTRVAWGRPVVADGGPVVDDFGNAWARGHQFMPSLTFSQGRLVLVHYDSRLDHTRGLFDPSLSVDPVAGTTQYVLNRSGRYYSERRRAVGGRDPDAAASARFLDTNGVDGFDFFDDAQPIRNVMNPAYGSNDLRRTLDVRVAMAPPGGNPVFSGATVTSYGIGAMDLKFFPSQSPSQLQQLGANPPNLMMFKQGTIPFLGDYIDVQGQTFVLSGRTWTWNTAWNGAPVFHAVWTTNQNVRPPADGDWTRYTPIKLPDQTTSYYDPNAPVQTFCAGAGGAEGSRNQDIYTARISEGLVVSSPQNAKPISTAASKPTSFVVAAQNTTSATRRFRFGLAGVPAGMTASFSAADSSVASVEVEIPAHSSAARSVFATVPSGSTVDVILSSFAVTVTEVGCGATCLHGSLTVNPPGSVSSVVPPAGCTDAAGTGICDISKSELWLATMSNAIVVDATALSPTNQAPTNQALSVKDPTNQAPTNQAPTNQAPTNQAPTNQAQTVANSTVQNPVLLTPTNQAPTNQATAMMPTNQAPTNQAPTNQAQAVSDYSVDLTNGGNTSASFHLAFVKTDPNAVVPSPLQVLVTKFYYTPSASDCQLVEVANGLTEVNVPDISGALASTSDAVDPLVSTSAATNVTVVLAPGEKKTVTLRAFVPLSSMADFASKVAVAAVPHGGTGSSSTYGDPAISGRSTTTSLTRSSGGTFTASVTSPQGGTPSGTVQILVNGVAAGLPLPLSGGAVGPFTAAVTAPSDQVVAFYPGDFAYQPSASSPVTAGGIVTITTISTSPRTWTAGTPITVSARITSGDPLVTDFAPLAAARPAIEFEIDGVTTTRQTAGLVASITVDSLTPGPHSVTARFRGTPLLPDYLPSDSTTLTQVVAAPNAWTTTGALAAARQYHTGTLLPSGRVLVAGGFNPIAVTVNRTAELYDPATGTWEATGSMSTPRWMHTATLLPSGEVLVVGGMTDVATSAGNPTASAELYDPVSGSWRLVGALSGPLTAHTATLLPNGRVLVAGGLAASGGLAPATAQLFDPVTGTWSSTGLLGQARAYHTATLLTSGRVLVAGGAGAGVFASAEIYDPASGAWSSTGALGTGRWVHTATLLDDGQVLVAAGEGATANPGGTFTLASAELYDPTSGTWSATGSLTIPRETHSATLLPSGKVLVAGGTNGGSLESAALYDPAAGTWSSAAALRVARSGHNATLLGSGLVLVSGGRDASAELYTPAP